MPTELKPSGSRNFLSFPGCGTCLAKPCKRLRFGRVYPGKFLFIHRRDLGFGQKGCPFVATSFDEVRQLLSDCSLLDLISCLEDILSALSIEEQQIHDQGLFVDGYDDFQGRVRLCEALWDGEVLGVIRVPLYFVNKEITRWLYANESLDYTLKNDIRPEAENAAAVTDSMANQPAAQAAPPPEKKQEITEIEVSVEGEEGPRKVNSNGTLEIVPDFLKPRKVTCREINGVPVTWAMSGYHYETKEGAKAEFEIKSWGIPSEILWFPHEKPKRIFVTAKGKNGKQRSATLNVYAGNKEVIEMDFASSEFFKFLHEFFDTFSETIATVFGKEIKFKFLQGAAGLKANFKEHSDNTVFYEYDLSAGFSPLVGLELKVEYSVADILPVRLKPIQRFAKFLKGEIVIGCAISVNGHIAKEKPDKSKFTIKPEAKIIGVGVSFQTDLTGGNDDKKQLKRWHIIDAKVGSETAVNAEFDPVQEKHKIGFLTSVKWTGIAMSGYIVALDGLFNYKKDIVLVGEKTWVNKREWLIFK
jgi:hypothetical protein